MIVDIERLVADHLRDDPAVEDIVGRRVLAYPPDEGRTSTAWIRLTLLDAPSLPGTSTDHLVGYLVQLDCYASGAGGQPEASLLARSARAALHAMPATDFDDAVVSSVRFTGMIRLPDTDFEPARERVILTTEIHAHPA